MASVTRTAVKPLQGGVGYELTGVEEWAAEAVEATFDGSGAAGDFLACLSLYSPGGALMSRSFPDDAVSAGDVAKVTYAPFLRKTGGAAAAGSALPWCQAQNATHYVAGDYAIGRSPDPLAYHFFSTTDATAFAFSITGVPGANDGDVHILRSGLYLIRLSVAPSSLTAAADPGYTWDLAIQARGQDAGGAFYIGMDFAPASIYYSGMAYGFYLSPRDNFATAGYTAPNGNNLQGAGQAQAPETTVYLNLDDSVVTWPVAVYAHFNHGLNDADIFNPKYSLLVLRVTDSNPAAPTG